MSRADQAGGPAPRRGTGVDRGDKLIDGTKKPGFMPARQQDAFDIVLQKDREAWGDEGDVDETELLKRISRLPRDALIAVYEQKCTNFRHYDLLRWQVPGLVFAVGGVLFGLGPKQPNGQPHSLLLGFYGAFALVCAYIMHRVGFNLRRNNRSLRRFAICLGDFGTPPPAGLKSASTLMLALLCVVGVIALSIAFDIIG